MADRPTITTLSSGQVYDTDQLNTNFQALRDAFDNVVGRNGTGGSNNDLLGDLELGGYNIRNSNLDTGTIPVSSFGETLIDDADASAARTTLGVTGTLATQNINPLTDVTITTADEIVYGDVSDSNNLKKDTVQGIINLASTDIFTDIENNGFQLGGSGAANLLDDYEEGTWTPTLTTSGTDFTSVTYDPLTGGRYIKIGNLVHIQMALTTDAVTIGSANGNAIISGLPFTVVASTGSTGDGYSSMSVGVAASFAGEEPLDVRIRQNSTIIDLYYRAAVTGNSIAIDAATDINTVANSNQLYISGSYITS